MSIAASPPAARPAASTAAPGMAAVAILVVGTAWHARSYPNTDIAWLLTVGERLLDGAMPYRDIIETNPPGSVLLYLPAILIGRAAGVDPQLVVMLLTGFACAAALASCALLLGPTLPAPLRGPLLTGTAAVLVLLPMGSFGQRDHIILLATLPLLGRLSSFSLVEQRKAAQSLKQEEQDRVDQSTQSCLAPREPMGRPAAGLAAGILAGVGLAIKPYSALGLVGPVLRVLRRAGWRGLVTAPDLWAAGVTAAALLGAQLLLFPAFTHDVLPLLGRVYLPMRLPLRDLLGLPGGAAGLAVLLCCALVRRARQASSAAGVPETAGLAALGFFAAYLAQGKGWAYHAYPCTALALIGLGVSLGPTAAAPRMRLTAARLGAAALAGWAAIGFDRHMDIDDAAPGLAAAVADLGPHPRVMSLAADLAVGHPLVRRVGGIWVGTLMSSWIDLYVDRIAPGRGRSGPLGPDLAFEDRRFAADIRDRHPDAVLADAPGWERWIAEAPETAAALGPYRRAGTYGDVVLWTRKPAGWS